MDVYSRKTHLNKQNRQTHLFLPTPEVAQCPPRSIFFIYVYNLSEFVILTIYTALFSYVGLFCTCHLLHVCPSWQRDPTLVGFFYFFPVKGLSEALGVFSHLNQGSKDRTCFLQTVKPLEVNLWFVIMGYINKTNLTWLDFFKKKALTMTTNGWVGKHNAVSGTTSGWGCWSVNFPQIQLIAGQSHLCYPKLSYSSIWDQLPRSGRIRGYTVDMPVLNRAFC